MAAGIYEFQQDLFHLIKALPALVDVAVIDERPRGSGEAALIQGAINRALFGGLLEGETNKLGLAVEVKLPSAEVGEANVPGPQLDLVGVIRLSENPMFNEGADGTGVKAEDAAMAILQACHHWQREGRVVYADRRALRDGMTDDDGVITYDVVVRTELGVQPVSRVAVPSISFAAGSVTLACATSGAAIYYTTDGSTPAPSNAEATLYAGPFSAAGGDVIRAQAFKGPLIPSGIVRQTLV